MEKVKISEVKENPDNPRYIKDHKFEKLVKSIKEFPEMLELRPIVVNDQMVVLGGNMRLKACNEAGLKEVPIVKASNLTPDQQKEFIIKDNISFGQWDWDLLANEWNDNELSDWAMDLPNYGNVDMLNEVNTGDENSEWVGMPEFETKDESLKIIVHFDNELDREKFAQDHQLEFLKKSQTAWSTNYPYTGRDDLIAMKYE